MSEEILQELLTRKRCAVSMEAFGQYMHESGEFDFKFPPAAHHKRLISALEGLVRGD